MTVTFRFLAAGLFATAVCLLAQDSSSPIGIFDSHSDVGTVLHAGTAEFPSRQFQRLHCLQV